MGTMENGEKMKMGSRNLRTQQIWLFDVIIKFGSLMSSLTFGSLMPFDENVEKEYINPVNISTFTSVIPESSVCRPVPTSEFYAPRALH